jgi:methylmalonyl-CoA/ethylmalonyl-CoA epimerase
VRLDAISSFAFHHVGYVVKEIEPVSEVYVTRFGYALGTPVIHDPVQTALVQFLSVPHDRVYLEFVSPDGPDSRLTNALRKGGGLNHLCYIADDLERASDWLVRDGMCSSRHHYLRLHLPVGESAGLRGKICFRLNS